MTVYTITKNVWLTDGDVKLAKGEITTSGDQVAVEIHPTSPLEHVISKDLTALPIPVSKSQWSEKKSRCRILDLNLISEVITINGNLINDSNSTAFRKKSDLLYLAGRHGFYNRRDPDSTDFRARGGVLRIVWSIGDVKDTENYEAYIACIKKMRIGEAPEGSVSSGERKFNVKIQLIEGANV